MRTRFTRLFGLVLVLVTVLGLAVPAGAQHAVDQPVNETPQSWFVELASPPRADGTDAATLKREKDAFRAEARRKGVKFNERYAFDTLFNGFSVQADPSQLPALARVAGVKALYPVVELTRPVIADANEPEMATALAMTGADTTQSELGFTGRGIRVAVMDSGIDYDHPDLGGCFGAGCRVVTGYDFVGDDFAGPASTPAPDQFPDDCGGHGTHVAGIIGANTTQANGVRGVAPDVTFGAYRVFGCEGSTTADIMIAAMERALADDMQILNMSIGSAFQWPQYPTATASDRLVNKGVVVVASIGNSGADGLYAAGAPGLGNKVIGVASFDNSHISALTFRLPDGRLVPYLPMSTTPDAPLSGTTPEVVHVGRGCKADDYLGDPAFKVALIERGSCTFDEKYQRAVAAGAVQVVIYNNGPGIFAGGGITARNGVSSVGIARADGLAILEQLKAGAVTLEWTDIRVNAQNPTGGLISSFSSYGLSPDLNLKPDIGAPGGLIRSTYPLEKSGGYAILSGTSMSSPHVAGGVALLLQARPRTPAQAVRGILQNSADPKPWNGNPRLGFLDNVHRQGAGMVDVDDAILSTTKVEPAKLALGESEAGPATRSLTIENNGPAAVTYDLAHAPALSTIGSTGPGFDTGFASVAFGAASVTVPAGGTATVDVTIAANPKLADGGQYGGYLVLAPQGGGQTYRVPYAGFKGDYQSIPVLTPTANGFPWLAKQSGTSYTRQPADLATPATYTLANGDIPYVLAHLDHQARRLRLEVRDAVTGQSWHRAYEQEYLPRNSTAAGFFAFAFDGTTTRGKEELTVPNGRYVLVLTVEKALSDGTNPAHFETWTSPAFTIARP